MEAAVGFGVALAIALLVPSYVDVYNYPSTSSEWYDAYIRKNMKTWIAPPAWVFSVVWFILYIFMVIAIATWSLQLEAGISISLYIGTWIAIAFNILFIKLWTVIFFSYRNWMDWSFFLAFIDAVLMFATALTVAILFHVSDEDKVWVFVLWWIYVAWTLYMMILSVAIWLCYRGGRFKEGFDILQQ